MLEALLAVAALAADPARDFPALLDEAWEFELREHPLGATAAGDHRYDDRLPSLTHADLERRAAFQRQLLDRLAKLERGKLKPSDQVSYDVFERSLRDALEHQRFGTDRIPITADEGFHTELARLPAEMTLRTTRDYENYIARLRAFPRYVGEQIALMREGLRAGFTLPRVVLEGIDAPIRAQVVDDVAHSGLFKPFTAFPSTVPEADRERLRGAGRAAVRDAAIPAFRDLLEFMTREYVPGARTTLGASELPDGKEYYAFLVRHFTTLEVTPDEVHQIGLTEVARIRAEMQAVIDQVGFKGDFAAFLQFLRSDPRFYAKTPEELLMRACFIAKTIDGKLPSLFSRLPRQPYGVEPVPAEIAPKYTGGRYVGAALDSTRAGTYWVNTYDLESRPFYTRKH